MISTTHSGASVWIVPFDPSWTREVTIAARVVTESERSLTGREFRRTLGASLRCEMWWRAVLSRPQQNQMRDALRVYDAQPVLAPAWPFAVEGTAWPGPVSGGLTIGWMEGWGSWALNPGTPADWDWVAPVLWGVLSVESPSLLSPESAEVEFALLEDGTATLGLDPAAVTWQNGPALNDATTPRVFPLPVDWSRRPRSVAPEIVIDRREIGRTPRTRAIERYPHSGSSTMDATITASTRAEVATLLRWWRDQGADVAAHYLETGSHVTDITADASAGVSAIDVEDASALGAYRFLAIEDAVRTQFVRVLSIAGSTLTLSAALSFDVLAGARVAIVFLGHHLDDLLELGFRTPEFAQARLAWRELTEEYIPAAGEETRGTTLGAGALKGWLYQFTVDRLGSPVVYRRTAYERDITASSQTWTAVPIKHEALRRSIRLDRDEVTIECRAEAWSNEFLPGRLTARVLVEISECDVSSGTGSNVTLRWSGEIISVTFEGPFVRAVARGPYALFDRPTPRLVIQPSCNHAVFDTLCALDRSAWTFTAVRVSNAGNQVTLGTWARSGGLPTGWGYVNYFALGYIEKGNERFAVLKSTALSSGQVTLTLDRTPSAWGSGETVNVIPGCDGQVSTCRAYHATTNTLGRFDNFTRFGGFPYVPAKNPSFTPPKRTGDEYGKK